jgi:hypothetical protein
MSTIFLKDFLPRYMYTFLLSKLVISQLQQTLLSFRKNLECENAPTNNMKGFERK